MTALEDSRRLPAEGRSDRAAAVDDPLSRVDAFVPEIVEGRAAGGVGRRGWLVRRALLAADLVGLIAAFLFAEAVSGAGGGVVGAWGEIAAFVASLPLWVVVIKLYGLYDHDEVRAAHSGVDDLAGIFQMLSVCSWLFWVATTVTGVVHVPLSKILIFWASALVSISAGRSLARAFARSRAAYVQNVVIVGSGDVAELVAAKLTRHREYGVRFLGFVQTAGDEPAVSPDGAVLGTVDRLPAMVGAFGIDRAIIASPQRERGELLDLVRSLNELGVQVDIVPQLFEVVGAAVDVHTIEGVPLLAVRGFALSRSSAALKRWIDLALAAAGLVLALPLMVVSAMFVVIDSGRPVFFRQVRVGSRGRQFRIWKFRTMTRDAEVRKHDVAHLNKHASGNGSAGMFKIDDDPRVTRAGRLLRRWSLDELPQLVNVLRGEMSLVGPRPLIPEEHSFVTDWARRRLELRPGMTGLWQVLGRDEISFEEMVKLDYLYVTSWSVGRDLRLLLQTVPAAFRGV